MTYEDLSVLLHWMDLQCRMADHFCCLGNGWVTSVTLPSALKKKGMRFNKESIINYPFLQERCGRIPHLTSRWRMDETFYSKPHANHHTFIHGLFSKPVWQSHTHSGYIGATHSSVSLTCGLEEPDTETLNVRPTSNKTHKVTSAWEVTMNCVSGHEHSLGVINWKLLTRTFTLWPERF